ncbi:MAG: hypothetical protein P1U38_09880 [Aeromicrobium sp.]|uniref:hypothetical protein n=1 Tax=Aeromicrobium sp. TaxID=1871063 RepID=UPI00261EB72F|nr:hypothetical protein [Aeromicrobium sp.]MDF1705071.1 hypothetical protein [Aeromicrobium sp.]
MSQVITIGTPIIVAFITVAGGCLTLWLKYKFDVVTAQARLAADRSKPTSNGFAQATAESLARIEARMDTHGRAIGDLNRALITHLQETSHG